MPIASARIGMPMDTIKFQSMLLNRVAAKAIYSCIQLHILARLVFLYLNLAICFPVYVCRFAIGIQWHKHLTSAIRSQSAFIQAVWNNAMYCVRVCVCSRFPQLRDIQCKNCHKYSCCQFVWAHWQSIGISIICAMRWHTTGRNHGNNWEIGYFFRHRLKPKYTLPCKHFYHGGGGTIAGEIANAPRRKENANSEFSRLNWLR